VARNLRRYLAGPFRNLAVLVEQPTRGTVNGLGDLGDGVLASAVPLALTVICWLGSPGSTALATWVMERLGGQVRRHHVDVVGQILPVTEGGA
jgi:hypothetical protein